MIKNDKNGGAYEAVLPLVRHYLEDSVYIKIWSELSSNDKLFMKYIVESGSGKAEDIKSLMKIDNGTYSVYRSRLIKSGIIDGNEHGCVKVTLPMFEEFVRENTFFDE